MKAARIAVLAVALGAGLLAARLAGNIGDDAPTIVEQAPAIETTAVLVAVRDVQPGEVLDASDVAWQEWPTASANATFVTRAGNPDAIEQLAGAVSRSFFFEGEPIREGKLVRADRGGFLAAVLPSGLRAVSTKTSPQTGAGGFILPNDRVDVILTRREPDPANDGRETYVSETILSNVRVLAIDQTIEEQDGRKVVVGNVATLALKPEQAEVLALGEQLGEISLSLRSILDGNPTEAEQATVDRSRRGDLVNVVKFGVQSQQAGAQ